MKLKISKGDWEFCQSEIDPKKYSFAVVSEFGTQLVADVYKKRIWDGGSNTDAPEVSEANATLIADAGTTYNKCGLTPSELLSENKKLVEILKSVRRHGLIEKDGYETVVKMIGEAIPSNQNQKS